MLYVMFEGLKIHEDKEVNYCNNAVVKSIYISCSGE